MPQDRRDLPDVPLWKAEEWPHYLDLLALQHGERLLDVGCDVGGFCRLAAARLGSAGRAIGVDPSARALAGASARQANRQIAYLVRGDGHDLPFADRSFDVVASLETVEYLHNPSRFVREAYRVLRRGGRFLLVHRDYDTLIVPVANRDLARRVVAALSDAGDDGWAGRKLRGYMVSAPWTHLETATYTPVLTSYAEAREQYGWVDEWLAKAVLQGLLPAEDLDAWQREQQEADAAGGYLLSLTRFICLAQK